jgi:hypothetical protein
MADLERDFWTRQTGTVQQVAQLHDRYMMMMMMMMMIMGYIKRKFWIACSFHIFYVSLRQGRQVYNIAFLLFRYLQWSVQ